MKYIFIIYLVLGFTDSSYSKEGFYTQNDLSNQTKIVQATKAVHKLEELSNSCSGAFISSEGHFLTAIHCIKFCLDSEKLADFETGSFPKYKITRIKENTIGKICPFIKIKSLNLEGAQIAAIGSGYSLFDEAFFPYYDEMVLNNFSKYFEDFVVLKFNITKPVSCLNLSEAEPLNNDILYSIGYPGQNTRSNGKGSNGNQQYITIGQKTNSINESTVVQNLKLLASEPINKEQFADLLAKQLLQSGILLLDNDNFPGMSGGPILNNKGHLVGVDFANMGVSSTINQSQYFKFSTLGVSISRIRNSIELSNSSAYFNKLFKCENVK